MSGQHTPGPQRASMQALQHEGFAVREIWLGDYFDGISATKQVGAHTVEIYSGGADDGEPTDLHYAPVVYVDERRVAGNLPSVEKAARVAEFRALMLRAIQSTGAPT